MTLADDVPGWSVRNDGSKNILVLENFSFISTLESFFGVIFSSATTPITIEVYGDNKIEMRGTSLLYGVGINVNSNLTISGDGILTIIGGNGNQATSGIFNNGSESGGGWVIVEDTVTLIAQGGSNSGNSSGIHASDGVDIRGGTVYATGGPASSSSGIDGSNFKMSGGTLYAKGNLWGIGFTAGTTIIQCNNIIMMGNASNGYIEPIKHTTYYNGYQDKFYYMDYAKHGSTVPINLKLMYTDNWININYDANGGDLGAGPSQERVAVGYNYIVNDYTPYKSGYDFYGWAKKSTSATADYNSGDTISAGNTDVTLYAVWKVIKYISVYDNTTNSNFTVENETNLDDVYDRVVTSEDLSEGVVSLILDIKDINSATEETNAIRELADIGSEVYFFDVTLTKNAGFSIRPITNTPIPVEFRIKLTGDLADKSYYKVYRYHGGVAEQISNDTSKTEHYVVDIANSEIIIYTMKFSTYAIFGNDLSLQDLNESQDVDVQAKITDNSVGIYKVDISWGAMAFEWDSSDRTYDPDTHEWIYGAGGSCRENRSISMAYR